MIDLRLAASCAPPVLLASVLMIVSPPQAAAQTSELVLFHSFRNGPGDIFIMDANGDGEVAVDPEPGSSEVEPQWSPSGDLILHSSDRSDPEDSYELWVMNPDGSGKTRLTNNSTLETEARWSPDGAFIYFRGPNGGIYRIDADGDNETEILVDTFNNLRPDPEPNGLGLLFVSNRDGSGNLQIYRLWFAGNIVQQLTTADARSDTPTVSPDGSKIAFYSTRSGVGATWIMNANGSGQTELVGGVFPDSWSADGERIYGHVSTSGRIVSFLADGTDFVYLTDGGTDSAASASPWIFMNGFESGDTSAW